MKQLENTLQNLKYMLIEDGYKDDNIVLRTLIKAQQQVKNLNISDVSGSVSKEDKFLIDGSGLFFFKSRLDDKKKLEIVKWYKNLSDEHREFVDIIRSEAIDETDFFSDAD